MNTPAAPAAPRSNRRGTSERRVAGLFGLKGDSWMRHANPWSVWTRFAVLPLLILAVWSREACSASTSGRTGTRSSFPGSS